MIYLKVFIFILLTLTFTGLFFFLRKNHVVKHVLTDAYTALDEASLERNRAAKREALFRQTGGENAGFFARLLETPEKRFVYSGINRMLHIPFEIWLVLKTAAAAILYFAVFTISRHIFSGLAAVIIYFTLLYGVEQFLAYRNYKAVDENLLNMVNLMSNFSITSGEITSIFHQISRYLPEPLSSVLEECYYDAQTSGDTSTAMYAMIEKIEHPMFGEFVRNIEICASYTANFSIIVKNSRKLIRNEQRAKKERRAIANDNLVDMFLISLVLVAALFITDYLIDVSIWTILFHTGIGRLGLVIIGIIYFIFAVSVITAER